MHVAIQYIYIYIKKVLILCAYTNTIKLSGYYFIIKLTSYNIIIKLNYILRITSYF